jgi:hypothetical protein
MKTFCCAAAMTVVLSGCVSAPTKSLDSGSTLQGKHVVVSHYEKPDFSAMTPGKAVFGLIGAAAMISAGNTLVKTENIQDPAIEISEHLANDMAEKRSATVLPAQHPMATDDRWKDWRPGCPAHVQGRPDRSQQSPDGRCIACRPCGAT